jgi:hypothetical protein
MRPPKYLTSLESSYDRLFEMIQRSQLQRFGRPHRCAASSCCSSSWEPPRDDCDFLNCVRAGTSSEAFETAPCQIELAKVIKRYVTDRNLELRLHGQMRLSAMGAQPRTFPVRHLEKFNLSRSESGLRRGSWLSTSRSRYRSSESLAQHLRLAVPASAHRACSCLKRARYS